MIAKRKQATQTQEKFEQNLRNQTIQAAKIGRELGYLECFIEFAHEYGCIDIEKISEEDYLFLESDFFTRWLLFSPSIETATSL